MCDSVRAVIGRLRGVVAEKALDGSCIFEVGGVGYELFVPLGTLGRLPAAPDVVTVHVHTHVREDALLLYAFATPEDRAAFRVLLGVSSIGPKLALSILGALDARELAAAIATKDTKRFKGISGVGKRTVERLMLELEDKLGFVVAGSAAPVAAASAPRVPDGVAGRLDQVRGALVTLGFKPHEAERAIATIAPEAGEQNVEALLKSALQTLS